MIESYITSSMEGRFRIRHPFITNVGLADAILTFLRGQPNLLNAKVNVISGSILVEYDPSMNTQENIIGDLEEFAMTYCVENDYLEELMEYEESVQKKNRCGAIVPAIWAFDKVKTRAFLNRSMLLLLVTSVGLVAFNKDRGHVLAAGLFTTLATVHLYINRKRF